MRLFARKEKTPKGNSTDTPCHPTETFHSTASRSIRVRLLAGSCTSGETTMLPTKLPKVDLPRPSDPQLDPVGYLRSLASVRERSRVVFDKATRNELNHFDVDLNKLPDVVTFVAGLIKRDYKAPFTTIPGHGRYQHFSAGGRDRIADLLSAWPESVDNTECCRRLLDLFLVSVLLDAGAGTQWSYKSKEDGMIYQRSEGLAIASLEIFKEGLFSSNPENKHQVDKDGLKALNLEKLQSSLQSCPGGELTGLGGRTDLLLRLSDALADKADYFGTDGRPGNMVDHLLSHPSTQASSILIVPLHVLWNVLMKGLGPIWPPSRTALNGVSLGDAWPCQVMSDPESACWESIIPFHKLTQWLTYSLMQPMQSLLNMRFVGQEFLTGLPEYRNGGLFVDLGVLTLKAADAQRGLLHYADYCKRTETTGAEVAPMFEPGDDVIVEWRGVTIGLLDLLRVEVNKALQNELAGNELTLSQLLAAGSWKGGREIAEIHRPNTREPPILIDSDGTVF